MCDKLEENFKLYSQSNFKYLHVRVTYFPERDTGDW